MRGLKLREGKMSNSETFIDEVTEENQRESLQKLAPASEDGLYLVPKVLE